MAKYGSGLSTGEVCILECNECLKILKSYHVSDEEIKRITDTIEEAYFQLGESYKTSRMFEAYLADEYGEDKFQEMLKSFIAKRVGNKPAGPKLAEEIMKAASAN